MFISQAGFFGNFGENDTCATIATVSATAPAGPNATFTVTPTTVGSCNITITGGSGAITVIPVSVTTSGIFIQSNGKRGAQ